MNESSYSAKENFNKTLRQRLQQYKRKERGALTELNNFLKKNLEENPNFFDFECLESILNEAGKELDSSVKSKLEEMRKKEYLNLILYYISEAEDSETKEESVLYLIQAADIIAGEAARYSSDEQKKHKQKIKNNFLTLSALTNSLACLWQPF